MRRLAQLVGLTLLLSACFTQRVQEIPELTDWPMRQAVLGSLNEWSLVGRIGIRTPEDSSSGSLDWQQRREQFKAEIDGPLGIGGLRMEGDARAVTLSGSRVETVTVPDPEFELERQAGVRVPVAGLRYWLLGVPLPGEPADIVFDDSGLPVRIEQAGWSIDYTEYRQWSLNRLPRKIRAVSGETRLTVIIRDWQIPQQALPRTTGN